MIPAAWRAGEVAVLGLARSGSAASRWLARNGFQVYASDAGEPPVDVLRGLKSPGLHIETGRHDLDRVAASSVVVVSPGIPPEAEPVRVARNAGIEIISEVELANRVVERKGLIAVTGTNGKTTTTSLVATVLGAAGVSCRAAGNIGSPFIELADVSPAPDWVVLEVSSFQLHDCKTLSPEIGVLTNLSPDHLDRYAAIDDYYADKRNLFANAKADSVWVTDRDDAEANRLADGASGQRLQWSVLAGAGVAAGYDSAARELYLGETRLIRRPELGLLGDHNVANALAAAIVCREVGVGREGIARGLRQARPLRHRLEVVGTRDGARWINDSKATNVSSAAVAIDAMDDSFALLMGGRHKGESYTSLIDRLGARSCVGVVAFGEAAGDIEADLGSAVDVTRARDLREAAAVAASLQPETILLSPACSSYDQFTNYEERGDVFTQLAGGG